MIDILVVRIGFFQLEYFLKGGRHELEFVLSLSCPFVRVVILLILAISVDAETRGSEEFFEMRVRPLLAENCFSCHAETAMGGLRMESLETLLQGGETGPALVPGHPD